MSSFGISGTNAHVILEEPAVQDISPPPSPSVGGHDTEGMQDILPAPNRSTGDHDAETHALEPALDSPAGEGAAAGTDIGVVPWVLSGRTPDALRGQAERLRAQLAGAPELDTGDIGFSLAASRSVFEHRAVVVGADREALLGGLDALARGGVRRVCSRVGRGRARSRWRFCSPVRALSG